MQEMPKISCVMVTGMDRGSQNLPLMAIDCFKKQTYQNRELVIINHGIHSYSHLDEKIREVFVNKTPELKTGALRNIAWHHSAGDYMMTWDDDDWHSQDHIEYQASQINGKNLVMLSRTLFFDLKSESAFVIENGSGAKATMLFPKSTKFRFQNSLRCSDVVFSKQQDFVLLDNDPSLYIRFHHGENLTPISLFYRFRKRPATSLEVDGINFVIDKYGLLNDKGIE